MVYFGDMSKPVIAVDFDDVVLGFHDSFRDRFNRLHGTSFTYDQLTNYDNWEKVYGLDPETMTRLAFEFYHSPDHDLIKPLPQALESITDLARDYSLQIVTSRPESVKTITLNWLERHLPGKFSDFHFTNLYAGQTGSRIRKKSEVCKALGARAFIDDALKHVRDVASVGIPSLLPDRPWNRTETPPGVHRMQTWDDMVKWIRTNV
jgi:uncharacterized HAD superfamily protein